MVVRRLEQVEAGALKPDIRRNGKETGYRQGFNVAALAESYAWQNTPTLNFTAVP